jgi:sugar/nucleoside kinase (ribokinase family)
MKKIVTFGEVMGRLSPEGVLRFSQVLPGRVEMTFGGAEANGATSLALLGARAEFVTALPKNAIAERAWQSWPGWGWGRSTLCGRSRGGWDCIFLRMAPISGQAR